MVLVPVGGKKFTKTINFTSTLKSSSSADKDGVGMNIEYYEDTKTNPLDDSTITTEIPDSDEYRNAISNIDYTLSVDNVNASGFDISIDVYDGSTTLNGDSVTSNGQTVNGTHSISDSFTVSNLRIQGYLEDTYGGDYVDLSGSVTITFDSQRLV